MHARLLFCRDLWHAQDVPGAVHACAGEARMPGSSDSSPARQAAGPMSARPNSGRGGAAARSRYATRAAAGERPGTAWRTRRLAAHCGARESQVGWHGQLAARERLIAPPQPRLTARTAFAGDRGVSQDICNMLSEHRHTNKD